MAVRTGATGREGWLSCGAFSLKCLVNGPEPAHVGAGREQDEPQESHAKVGGAAASAHPRQAADQVNGEGGGIHCQRGGKVLVLHRQTLKLVNLVPGASLMIVIIFWVQTQDTHRSRGNRASCTWCDAGLGSH